MSNRTGKVLKIKKRLLREHRFTRSWRELARSKYPTVKFGTLQRFATDPGYIPTDDEILIALGLKKKRNLAALPKYFERTPKALEWFVRIKKRIKDESVVVRTALRRKKAE